MFNKIVFGYLMQIIIHKPDIFSILYFILNLLALTEQIWIYFKF